MHLIIKKLKNKHTYLKNIQTEKAEEPVILVEREETKTRYFAPKSHQKVIKESSKSHQSHQSTIKALSKRH